MIKCSKCGYENNVGRVFCDQCGTKLDVKKLSSEELAARMRTNWLVAYWPWIVTPLLLALLVMVVMALIPHTGEIGQKGTRLGGRRIEAAVQEVLDLEPRGVARVTFDEKDVNGYFEFFKAEKLGVKLVSVNMLDGRLAVRVVKGFGSIGMVAFRFEPVLSYDLLLVPVAGNRFAVTKVRMGRLTLSGPMRSSVIRKVYGVFAGMSEWKIFRQLESLTVEQDEVNAVFKKDG